MICVKSPAGELGAPRHSGFLMKVYNVAAGNNAEEDLHSAHSGAREPVYQGHSG